MDKIELHKAVARTVTAIFGKHPRRVELDDTPSVPVVTIYYQDFLSPATLHHTLSSISNHPVEWNFERTMSIPMRHRLLEELYYQPEILADHPEYRNNVRYYLFDRFATTDFSSLIDVNIT